MRGKDFFEFLCQLVLEEAGQKEQFSPGTRSTSLETCLTEVFPLGKSSNSEFNAGGGGPGLAASVLVVSHGAFMRNLFDYFLTDLRCSLPAALSKFELTSVSPNTGISLFVIHLEEGRQPVIQCVCMNLREHLNRVTEAH
jgi:fructose-2,6-bisphosphatase